MTGEALGAAWDRFTGGVPELSALKPEPAEQYEELVHSTRRIETALDPAE